MNKYIGIFSAVAAAVVALLGVFTPQITALVAANPGVATFLAAAVAILAALSKAAGGSQDK